MKNKRGLEKDGILWRALLPGGELAEVTDKVKNEEKKYWLGIRDDRVILYYLGGKILEIETDRKGNIKLSVNGHYFRNPINKTVYFNNIDEWKKKEDELRDGIADFQKSNNKEKKAIHQEKISQQEFMLKNNSEPGREWYLADMEYSMAGDKTAGGKNPREKNYGRFDIIGISQKKDSQGKHKIALIELKSGTNAFGGVRRDKNKGLVTGSGLAGHVVKFYRFLYGKKGKDNLVHLAQEIKNIIAVYKSLGIYTGCPDGEIDTTPESVECIIVVSDVKDKEKAVCQMNKYLFDVNGASEYNLEKTWHNWITAQNFATGFARLKLKRVIVDHKERVIKNAKPVLRG